MPATVRMNLKMIMLRERSQTKRNNTARVHLYKTLENANSSVSTESRSVVVWAQEWGAGREQREEKQRTQGNIVWGGDE